MRRTLVHTGDTRSSGSHTSRVMLSVVGSSDTRSGTSTSRSSAHTDGLLNLLSDRLLGSVRLVLLSSDAVDFFIRGRGRRGRVGPSSCSTLQAFTGQAASGSPTQAGVVCAGSMVRGGRSGLTADTSAESTGDGVGV